jgi:hypothetical protein
MDENQAVQECLLLKGSRELTPNDFYLQEDAADWDDGSNQWSYYLAASGNMDEIFGTQVETSENNDYLNVYASVDPDFGSVEDCLSVTLWQGDGGIKSYDYALSDREKEILLVMILEYEMKRMDRLLQKTKTALEVS